MLFEYLRPESELKELVEGLNEDMCFFGCQAAEIGNDKLNHVGNDRVESRVEQFTKARSWTRKVIDSIDYFGDPRLISSVDFACSLCLLKHDWKGLLQRNQQMATKLEQLLSVGALYG